MSGFRLIVVGALLSVMVACAIDVSPSSYIYQDTEVQPVDTTALSAAAQQDEISVSISTVELTNAQGLNLSGVAVAYGEPKVNIIFFGGNGQTISRSAKILHHFGKIPANVLWVDYQGMGSSEKAAKISIKNLKADALMVFDYAREIFSNDLPVVVHGLSMGSLVASYIADERKIDGLVLDGAINSVPEVMDNMIPAWSKFFTNVNMDPELAAVDNGILIEQYRGPLLLFVGDQDRTTPVSFSQQLYRLSPSENKDLIVVKGASHGNTMKFPQTIARYKTFVASL